MTDAAAEDRGADETLRLIFRDQRALAHVHDPIHRDLSAAARCGDSLFLSCDETAGIDRLTEGPDGWQNHAHFPLGRLVDLPAGPDGEMDIEGLHCDGDWLWIVGSHSLKRGKAERDEKPLEESLEDLAEIKRDPNRFFLARVPLLPGEGGAEPVAIAGSRRIAHIKLKPNKSKLRKWLKKDRHLRPFLDLPCKENGFDIEGIAARDLRVWIGLRGPVLRGWAIILELEMKITGSGRLKAKRIDGKRRYRKHFIDAAGMGIRDLSLDGEDILILTGPTMAGDGQCRVLRWRDAAGCTGTGFRRGAEVTEVLTVPYRGPVDHAEGLAPWTEGRWLIVYDSPAGRRLTTRGSEVTADVWRLSDAGSPVPNAEGGPPGTA
ncbi:DUF3616 domain-containing protein [Wenxinia marina]|uniref:Wenxma_18, whole genome shotgun sequence n=1 Tax=Wenxinia marina DSM 24838 TaxID=1123501 RepID=A0A0D0PZX0_9RHOB|nr:DUF3616 domain-containing protein [Wenxinia marina]KIQ67909.1 hypothetical protein Wenmar_03640 [Wenxinia marina DSM 24838]GGL74178.1 hypothetical protein GCM10011392_30870 [Wenxinia marina]